MKLTSNSFADGQRIPGDYSFCVPDPAHHVCLGNNLNPHLAWTEVPSGTQSKAPAMTADPRIHRGAGVGRHVQRCPVGDPQTQRPQRDPVDHAIALAVAVGGVDARPGRHGHDQRMHDLDVVQVDVEVTDPIRCGGYLFGQRPLGVGEPPPHG